MEPTVFLDIDGVINIFPPLHRGKTFKNGKHRRYWDRWEQKEFFPLPDKPTTKYLFTHSPDLIGELVSLKEEFPVMWLTTWEKDVHDLLPELIETNELVLPFLANTGGTDDPCWSIPGQWWKVKALEAEIARDPRPFVWVEDLYTKELRLQVQSIAEKHGVTGDLIRSYEAIGMTKETISRIRSFFESLESLDGVS